jgi:hypothetical protein
LKTEIEEGTRRWEDFPCSWIDRINIVNMVILPEALYIFNVIPIKIPILLLLEIKKINLKFHMDA